MRNKIICFMMFLLVLTPSIFTLKVTNTTYENESIYFLIAIHIFTQLFCFPFYYFMYIGTKDTMFTFNRKQVLRDIFGKNVQIHNFNEKGLFNDHPLYESYAEHEDKMYNAPAFYEIDHKNKTYIVQFGLIEQYSFKELLHGKAAISKIDDFTKEKEAALQKQKENLLETQKLKKQTEEMIKEIQSCK